MQVMMTIYIFSFLYFVFYSGQFDKIFKRELSASNLDDDKYVQKYCSEYSSLDSLNHSLTGLFSSRKGILLDLYYKQNITDPNADISSEYSKSFYQYIIPFVVLIILFIALWVVYCCCNYECCFNCCKVDQTQVYSSTVKCLPLFGFFICTIGIIACCIIEILSIKDISSEYKKIECSFAISLNEIINGTSSYSVNENKWTGIKTLIQTDQKQITAVKNDLSNSDGPFPDIVGEYYNNPCISSSSTTYSTALEALLNASKDAGINQIDSPRSAYSLIINDPLGSGQMLPIEYDRTDFINKISSIITEEYNNMSHSIPLIRSSLKSMVKSNLISILSDNVHQYDDIPDKVAKHESDLFDKMGSFDNVIIFLNYFIIVFCSFQIFILAILSLSIILFTGCNQDCFKELNNFCWNSLALSVLVETLLFIFLLILGILSNDICNFLSYESLTNEKMNEVQKKYYYNGSNFFPECAFGQGNFGNVIGFPLVSNSLNVIDENMAKIGNSVNVGGLLRALDLSFGKRLDHCCLSGLPLTQHECSGLFGYSTYLTNADSMIFKLNDLLSSCPKGKRFQIVFYYTSAVNSYTDCNDGFTYVDKTANLPETGNICIVLADIFAKNIQISDFASSCSATTRSTIDLTISYLQQFEIGLTAGSIDSAEKLFTSPATLCNSFYTLTVYDPVYNKFSIFKNLCYQSGTECAPEVLTDISSFNKTYLQDFLTLRTTINNGLSCLFVKDMISRVNTTICQSFSGTVNWGFLSMIITCLLEMITIFLVILINRMFKKRILNEKGEKESSDIDKSAQNLTENDSGKTFDSKG